MAVCDKKKYKKDRTEKIQHIFTKPIQLEWQTFNFVQRVIDFVTGTAARDLGFYNNFPL